MIFILVLPFSFAELIVRWLDGLNPGTIKDVDQQQQTVMTMNKRKLVMDSNKHMLNYVEIIPGEFTALNRELFFFFVMVLRLSEFLLGAFFLSTQIV